MTGAPLLSPELVERIGTLKVSVERAVEGMRSGIHRSPHRGASVMFAEHRDYRPGDDIRLLDWRAFARNDRYTVKHFEQETHLQGQLLLDLSPSMAYGAPQQEKARYAATLLAALGLILLRQGDAVGAMHLGAQLEDTLPARTRGNHLDELLAFMATPARTTGQTHLQTSLLQAGERLRKRGLVALASDLLDPDPEAMRPLSLLRAQGHEVWVFHVLHPDEVNLPFREPTRFSDPESDQRIDLDPDSIRSAYRERLDAFVERCQAQCVAAGCRYTFARSDKPPQEVLASALRGRSGR